MDAKIQSPDTASFADIWYCSRDTLQDDPSGIGIPTKSALPLRSMVPLMPHIALVKDTEHTGLQYTLFGTGLAADFGTDLTGKPFLASLADASKAEFVQTTKAFHENRGKLTPFVRLTQGSAETSSGRILKYESLAFPYYEPSDKSVRYILHAMPLETLTFGEALAPCIQEHEIWLHEAADARPAWLAQDITSPLFSLSDVS